MFVRNESDWVVVTYVLVIETVLRKFIMDTKGFAVEEENGEK